MKTTVKMYGVISPITGTLSDGVLSADRAALARALKDLPGKVRIVPLTISYSRPAKAKAKGQK